MEKYLAEQNAFYDDFGIEFIPPLANGLLHFDIIVRPLCQKKRGDIGDSAAPTDAEYTMSDESPASSAQSSARMV